MHRARRKLVVLAFLVTTGFTAVASAQDAHYWTDQFGNRARILGGAVVGSARDLSATYYNPGGLALVPTAEILLAGNVLNYTRYDAITGPEQQKLSSSAFGLSPSLFAGEVLPWCINTGKSLIPLTLRYAGFLPKNVTC